MMLTTEYTEYTKTHRALTAALAASKNFRVLRVFRGKNTRGVI